MLEYPVMTLPQIPVHANAARRVRHFDGWVFQDELKAPAGVAPGTIVELLEESGAFLAYAFYHPQARLAARVLSIEQHDLPEPGGWLARRLRAAIARRDGLNASAGRRLIFSEADGLPGLIVDQYAGILVAQLRAAGWEPWRSHLVDHLRAALKPSGILERSDKEFRQEEGLPLVTQVLHGAVPERVQIEEDELKLLVDPHHGQKTGFYLDQRETRRAIRRRVTRGERVADVFSYTGAFGIGAAAQGAAVVCVEQDEGHLALAKENAALNGVAARMTFVAGNAFYWLEAKAEAGERFDWVLLDPPSLAKTKADVAKGRQALHHLLRHGLALMAEEGRLALSVCTYHLLEPAEEILRIAANERPIRLQVEALSLQAPDHPWIVQLPMSRYLMSWMARRAALPAA